jgi:hypothetical protein
MRWPLRADLVALDRHIRGIRGQADAKLGRQRSAEVAHLKGGAGQDQGRLMLLRQRGSGAHPAICGVLRQRPVVDQIDFVGAIGQRSIGKRADAGAKQHGCQRAAAGIS